MFTLRYVELLRKWGEEMSLRHTNDEHLIYSAVEKALSGVISEKVLEKIKEPKVQKILKEAIQQYFTEESLSEMVTEKMQYDDEFRNSLNEVIMKQVQEHLKTFQFRG
jgi:aspartate/glutamate racemase